MIASLSASGLVPISRAIAGSAVEMIVESMFSMNKATATISGTMRVRNISNRELAWSGVRTRRVSGFFSIGFGLSAAWQGSATPIADT